jgi:hypothetical protein
MRFALQGFVLSIGGFLEVFKPASESGKPYRWPGSMPPIPLLPAQSRIIAPEIRICRVTGELTRYSSQSLMTPRSSAIE